MASLKNHSHFIIALFCIIIFFPTTKGYSTTAPQETTTLPAAITKEYTISPGDILEISVWKEEDLSKTYSVRMDGHISVPLLGDIEVNNKTIRQLTKDLEEKFKTVITSPTVSIVLIESKSRRFYVIGKVIQSGEYNLDHPITALQALAKCGGFQEWAKTDEIKIVRQQGDKREVISFDYQALAEKGDLKQDLYLQPGDTIIIP